jgi:hypothetical protein
MALTMMHDATDAIVLFAAIYDLARGTALVGAADLAEDVGEDVAEWTSPSIGQRRGIGRN